MIYWKKTLLKAIEKLERFYNGPKGQDQPMHMYKSTVQAI